MSRLWSITLTLLGVALVLYLGEAVIRSGIQERASVTRNPFRLTLEAPASVRWWQSVPLVVRITNTSSQQVKLSLGAPIRDLWVTGPFGIEVWRLVRGAVADVLTQKILEGGESFSLEATWDQQSSGGAPLAPGVYLVYGFVELGDPPQRVELGPKRLIITPY